MKFEDLPKPKKGGGKPRSAEAAPAQKKVEKAVGKIISNVRFEIVRDKEGRPQGYKSSSLDRKKVVLDDKSQNIVRYEGTQRAYRVRIKEDSDPRNPDQGTYTVSVIEDDPQLEHKEAQIARSKRLRESRGFKVLAKLLHHPDLWMGYKPMADRHAEFRTTQELKPKDLSAERAALNFYGEEVTESTGRGRHTEDKMEDMERHRNMTGMLAGIMMSERGGPLLDRVIDRTVEDKSNKLKEAIVQAPTPPYVPEVVIGGGVYAAIMASTRLMYRPNDPALTLEEERRIGGQFGGYGGELFRLNSRNRRELPGEAHVPGTPQSLNTFADFAVMQPSDTSGETYSFQSSIAETGRVNLFLSGEAVTEARVSKIRKNYERPLDRQRSDDSDDYDDDYDDDFEDERESVGSLIVEFIDTKTNRILEVATDTAVFTTGVGAERSGLDERDLDTADILASEKRKAAASREFRAALEDSLLSDAKRQELIKEQSPRVYSFKEFAKAIGDPENPFPLRGIENIVLSGQGDSSTVIAGIVLGYEGQQGKTVNQLDKIEKIFWIGQAIETKEDWIENVRARYGQLGLEFPRAKFENYYSRIVPIAGARAERLQRTEDGGIRVLVKSSEASRTARPTDLRPVEGDLFVYAHGFQDETSSIVAPAMNRAFVREGNTYGFGEQLRAFRIDINNGNRAAIGSEIYYSSGGLKRVEVLDITGQRGAAAAVTIRALQRDGRFEDRTLPADEFIRSEYFASESISRIERPSPQAPSVANVFDVVRGNERVIARELNVGAGAIYKAGPAAELALTEEERRASPALEQISENTAAIFRYADYTEALARKLALENDTPPSTLYPLNSRRAAPQRLPSPQRMGMGKTKRYEAIVSPTEADTIGLEENTTDLLRLAVGDIFSDYSFPKNSEPITLTIRRGEPLGGRARFSIQSNPPLPPQYASLMRKLTQDSLMGALMRRITNNIQSGAMEVTIPFKDGGVDVPEVSYAPVR